MALEFLHRVAGDPARVVLFPGTWNPPTVAHVEIGRAAAREFGEVIWILPRALPHKDFEGAGFEVRCAMIQALARAYPGFSAALSEGGLYTEIAAEAREYFGPKTEIALVLGRDAAERIANWDYGRAGVFDDLVRRHKLLVAARQGEYVPAGHHAERIERLPMAASWDEVSSSELRRRIAAGEPWRHLAPPVIAEMVVNLYREGSKRGTTGTAIGTQSTGREP